MTDSATGNCIRKFGIFSSLIASSSFSVRFLLAVKRSSSGMNSVTPYCSCSSLNSATTFSIDLKRILRPCTVREAQKVQTNGQPSEVMMLAERWTLSPVCLMTMRVLPTT